MELLCDVGHVESRFVLFGGSAIVGARELPGLRQIYHSLKNRFECTRWYS